MMWNVFAFILDMFYDFLSETRMFSIDIIIYNFYRRSISSIVISN